MHASFHRLMPQLLRGLSARFFLWQDEHSRSLAQPRAGKQDAQSSASLPWRALLMVSCIGFLGLGMSSAEAQTGCTGGFTVTMNPPLPSTISLTQPVGTVVWSGQLELNGTNCSSLYSGNNWMVAPILLSSPSAIPTSTGVASGLTIQATGSDVLTIYSGSPSCSPNGSDDYTTYRYIRCLGSGFSNMSFKASFGALIKIASSPGPSVMSGSRLSTGTSAPWWGGGLWQSGYDEPGTSPLSPRATYVGVVPTLQTYACTVATPSVNVLLPTVSLTSLASAGATAGLTPFTFNFSGCTANGGAAGNGFSGTQTWTFTPDAASTTYIQNTGTAPTAGNVVVQLLDANMNPIANGGTTTLTVPKVGGALSQKFYARYVSKGGATSGNVRGVATFNIVYN